MKFDFRSDEDDDYVQPSEIGSEAPLPEADPEPSSLPVFVATGGTNFLDLPDEIKLKILKYAGLIRPCLISVTHEYHRFKHEGGSCRNRNPAHRARLGWTGSWVSPYYGPSCDHPALPVNVFLVSRAVHRELAALFFAHNRFTIDIIGKSEFNLFNAMTRQGLQTLRYLHLDLGSRHHRYLKISDGVHKTMMNIWIRFCANSREKMRALRYFSMKCKVKELDVASRLMCIMDPFPALAHCAFHFNNSRDDDIQPVLKRAAWRLTGNLLDKPPFPFKRLPKEVQLMILEYVLVDQSDPYLHHSVPNDPPLVGFLDRKRERPSMNCCGNCSPLRAMCFCEAQQTAFSTSCTCFSSPLPYFLVSRDFHDDCRRIFFSKNHFTVLEEDPEPVLRFMISIPTSSFMQIRHLSFRFPMGYRLFHKSAKNEDAAILSWCVLRRFIVEHFNLSRLSLSIIDPGTTGSVAHRNKYVRKMLKAFTNLQGLRDLQVYLADDHPYEIELECAVLGRPSVGRYSPEDVSSLEDAEETFI
ncbi:hypothetical protein BJX70DRAFT_372319 [Aspergillus crustosus]